MKINGLRNKKPKCIRSFARICYDGRAWIAVRLWHRAATHKGPKS